MVVVVVVIVVVLGEYPIIELRICVAIYHMVFGPSAVLGRTQWRSCKTGWLVYKGGLLVLSRPVDWGGGAALPGINHG